MRYSEKWGDSIDAAVELALQELKLTRDQVTVTVLEQPSKGFFGIGSKLAKVHVEEIAKEKEKKAEVVKPKEKKVEKKAEEPVQKAVSEAVSESEDLPVVSEKKKKKNNKKKNKKQNKENKETVKIEINHANISTRPEDLKDAPDHPAKEFLDKTFKEMGLEVSVSVAVNEDSVYIDVEGKDTGTVIGKRGQTLDALQYLTSLVVNKSEDEYIRVILDAEGYRAKREATLETLATRLAEKVLKTGKSARLEPMNPYERKVIHTALHNVNGISTRSEGDEPYRRVVIELKK